MKLNVSVCVLVSVLALSGCSSVKTEVKSPHVTARTFNFLETATKPTLESADRRVQAHALVQEAITKNLAAKGVSRVERGGDVLVAYLIIAGNNTTTTSLNDYFGYTPDAAALTDKVHSQQAIKAKNRGYFEAGSLVIDVIDPRTNKLLHRGMVESDIIRNLPLDQRETRVQSLVDSALSELRVAN